MPDMKSTVIKIFKYTAVGLWFLAIEACSGQPNLIENQFETVSREALRYYLYFPEDYQQNTSEEFPLLLFLHGGGEAGGRLENLQSGGPPKMIVQGKQFPFLILAPQHPHKKMLWNTRAVMQLLEHVISDHRIDQKRIYLSGLSRGGAAAWEMVVQYPNTFAALAVVCGMSPLPYASWINIDMPIWVFHGAEDRVIPLSESEAMVDKLRKLGYDVKFTKYPDVGHNAWDLAFETDSLYTWLMQQRLKD